MVLELYEFPKNIFTYKTSLITQHGKLSHDLALNWYPIYVLKIHNKLLNIENLLVSILSVGDGLTSAISL